MHAACDAIINYFLHWNQHIFNVFNTLPTTIQSVWDNELLQSTLPNHHGERDLNSSIHYIKCQTGALHLITEHWRNTCGPSHAVSWILCFFALADVSSSLETSCTKIHEWIQPPQIFRGCILLQILCNNLEPGAWCKDDTDCTFCTHSLCSIYCSLAWFHA